MEDKLSTITKDTGIELEKAKSIWVKFEGFFNSVTEAAKKVDGLEITDVSQREEMKLARSTRLELKNIRVAAEKTKKQLKDGVLKEGRFIDATYRLIADATKPVEINLLEKEQFAKRKEEERVQRLVHDRELALEQYVSSAAHFPLSTLTDEQFGQLLEKEKAAHAQRIAEEKAALGRAEAERAERERIEAENARLRAEAEDRERKALEERMQAEAARRAAEAEAHREREEELAAERARHEKILKEQRAKAEAEAAELRRKTEEAHSARRAAEEKAREERVAREAADMAAREEQLRAEREKREHAERELREKEAAERAERERIESERRAEEAERQRLEQASDAEKLTAYLDAVMDIEVPTVQSAAANGTVRMLKDCIQTAVSNVKTMAEKG